MTDRHPATVGHATSAPDACSILWQHDGTSAYGTAARAGFFVVIEQPGPWGRKAAEESHLPREVGIELDGRAAGAGGRFMLMRRPGPHVDRHGRHRVLVAHTGGAGADAWLLAGDVAGAEDLLSLDWTALAAGRVEAVAASLPGARPSPPALLICTNGRCDLCCAVRGRPLAAAAAGLDPDRVWEVSHTGGHRFAPTGVLLPWGQALARLDVETVALALEASLRSEVPRALLGPTHDRGRSALPAGLQAAESFIRDLVAETRLACLTTEAVGAGEGVDESSDGSVGRARVRHVDGREWQVRVSRRHTGQQRPESCGKAPVEVHEYEVTLAG
ncbi:MAG: sucrase ferredoxin [Intrasporangium sp.]|uniref:sucrase ferredoxin n=1 Tax=Intrasporangium sp. TaxID=1925024 RepID=UPI003F7FF819